MLAKLIVHAPTRDAAIERMARALGELQVVGLETSAPFHRRLMLDADFRAGRIDIGFLESHPALLRPEPDEPTIRVAALAAALLEEEQRRTRSVRRVDGSSSSPGGWRDRGWR